MKFLKMILCIMILTSLVGCSYERNHNKIIIYSSSEDFRNEYYLKELRNKFTLYEIDLQYISTGNCAAKLKSERTDIEADIIVDLESIYAEQLKDNFYSLKDIDYSIYDDSLIPNDKLYVPWNKLSGAIIFNDDILSAKKLNKPKTYMDLLKPEYKGLISMPNPKSSSTGYMFLKNIINIMGEKAGFEYFDKLTKNILQYTSSGSGPVNALIQGEAAIGLGMTFQAVNEINNGGNLSFTFFKEGSPWCLSTAAIVKAHNRKEVKEVFQFLISDICLGDKKLFLPEPIFRNQNTAIDNYPKKIKYADMRNNTVKEKEYILNHWKY